MRFTPEEGFVLGEAHVRRLLESAAHFGAAVSRTQVEALAARPEADDVVLWNRPGEATVAELGSTSAFFLVDSVAGRREVVWAEDEVP